MLVLFLKLAGLSGFFLDHDAKKGCEFKNFLYIYIYINKDENLSIHKNKIKIQGMWKQINFKHTKEKKRKLKTIKNFNSNEAKGRRFNVKKGILCNKKIKIVMK